MNIYSPAEVAKQLNIKAPTLRKYSIMLESKNYHINRNSQNHRYYTDDDIITLQRVITSSKSGITLEESVKSVVSVREHNTYTNDTDNAIEAVNNDDLLHKQIELTKALTEQLKEQEQRHNEQMNLLLKKIDELAIDRERIEERDKLLMNSLDEVMKQKKQDNSKGFFSRLFNR